MAESSVALVGILQQGAPKPSATGGQPSPSLTTQNTDGWVFGQVARVFVETECVSVETRRAYLRQLLQGAKMLGVKSVTDIRLQHLLVLRKLVMDSPASPSTKALFVAAWRSFLKWRCVRPVHGIAMDDVKGLLKAPRASVIAPYDILSKAEIAKMMDTAGTLRDRAILLVMLGGGLRASEVVGLDGNDIRLDAEGEYFLLVHGKGRKDRQVPVHQEVVDATRYTSAAVDDLCGTKEPSSWPMTGLYGHGRGRLAGRPTVYWGGPTPPGWR